MLRIIEVYGGIIALSAMNGLDGKCLAFSFGESRMIKTSEREILKTSNS